MFRSLGVKCFQPSLDISDKLCISPSYISFPSSVQVSGRTCYRQVQTSDSCCTMLDEDSSASHKFSTCWKIFLVIVPWEMMSSGIFW